MLHETVLTGIIPFGPGLLKVGRFISFIPYSVGIGYINSLAILIFLPGSRFYRRITSGICNEMENISYLSHRSCQGRRSEILYTVKEQPFFGTMTAFIDRFHYSDKPRAIEIDFQSSHIRDNSAVEAIARVIDKYQQENKSVYVTGLDIERHTTLIRAFPEVLHSLNHSFGYATLQYWCI